jgi:RecB family endonuclease NucS
MIDPVTLSSLLVNTLRSLNWGVRRRGDSEIGSPRNDLVVTDPSGKVYLVELKEGEDPVHFASIAQLERTARLLSEREGGNVTPVLLTNQAVRQAISQLAEEVGIQVVESPESESDQEAAASVIQVLQEGNDDD